jgi:Flp pilus assembly protein TadG
MRRKGEKGAAAVEFALVLPLLVMLLVGMMEFGLVLWRQEMITNATREAARAGIVAATPRLTEAEIQAVLEYNLSMAGIDPTATTITITGAGGASGDPLTVAVVYPYQYLVINQFATTLGATVDLTAQTVMFLE